MAVAERRSLISKFSRLLRENIGYTLLSASLVVYAGYVVWGCMDGWFVQPGPPKRLSSAGVIHLLFWTFGPPIWFFFEYHLETDPEVRKRIKDSQDLASKVWAAVLAVLAFSLAKQL